MRHKLTRKEYEKGKNSKVESRAGAVSEQETDQNLELYRPRWMAKYGEESWRTMTEQGLWSYPKAHAVVLANIAYTTAYLKTRFPEEYTRVVLCVAVSEDCE